MLVVLLTSCGLADALVSADVPDSPVAVASDEADTGTPTGQPEADQGPASSCSESDAVLAAAAELIDTDAFWQDAVTEPDGSVSELVCRWGEGDGGLFVSVGTMDDAWWASFRDSLILGNDADAEELELGDYEAYLRTSQTKGDEPQEYYAVDAYGAGTYVLVEYRPEVRGSRPTQELVTMAEAVIAAFG